MCPQCGRPKKDCCCKQKAGTPSADGIVRVGRETKGRKGKGVSLIQGVPLAGKDLTNLAKRLKSRCGSGGTVKNGVIEIQGDHRDLLVQLLTREGYRVKGVGG